MANKLFRKTSGSHAFVADFPATDGDGDVVFGGTEFDGGGCSPDPDDADASRCVKRARPHERNKTLKYKYVYSYTNTTRSNTIGEAASQSRECR